MLTGKKRTAKTGSDAGPSGPTAAAARSESSLRAVALPTEHGGWSLTLEPVLLGLIVAWSGAGTALGAAGFVTFLVRTPLKVVLVDRWRNRWLARTTSAASVAAVELLIVAALSVTAIAMADGRFWIPLAVAAPLVIIELWFDMRSRSRRLIPELAGTIGIGSLAAAIALADGTELGLAFGLWIVVSARAAAAIPFVRVQIARSHQRQHRRLLSDLAQALSVVVVSAAAVASIIPSAAAVAVTVAAALNIVAVRRPPRPVMIIGIQQSLIGVAVVAITAIAVLTS